MDNIATLITIFSHVSECDRLVCRLVCSLFRNTIDSNLDAWGLSSALFLPCSSDPSFVLYDFVIPFLNVILHRVNITTISDFKNLAPIVSANATYVGLELRTKKESISSISSPTITEGLNIFLYVTKLQ